VVGEAVGLGAGSPMWPPKVRRWVRPGIASRLVSAERGQDGAHTLGRDRPGMLDTDLLIQIPQHPGLLPRAPASSSSNRLRLYAWRGR